MGIKERQAGIRSKQNSLAFKVGLGFSLIGLILICALLITIWNVYRIDKLTAELLDNQKPYTEYSLELMNGLDQAIMAERDWVVTQNQTYKNKINSIWEQNIFPTLSSLQSLTHTWTNSQNLSQLESIEANINKLQTILANTDSISQTRGISEAINYIITDAIPLTHDIRSSLEKIISTQEAFARGSLQEVQLKIDQVLIIDLSFLIIGLLLCGILGVILTRSINRPIYQLVNITRDLAKGNLEQDINIKGTAEFEQLSTALNDMVNTFKKLSQVTEQMAMGDYSQRVEVKSDDDILAITVNQMLDSFNQIVGQANKIAKGDYSTDITPRSKHDALGAALSNMTKTLRENQLSNKEENWFKDGLNQLASTISGIHDMPTLCGKAISTICRYVGAGMGVIYIYEKRADKLKLYGSHAFEKRSSLSNEYKLGEGIVGQVALEQKSILLTNIKAEDCTISTGTTQQAPLNIYTYALIYEEKIMGVIEIASHTEFTENQLHYFKQSERILATQIQAATQQTLTESLLNESKSMTQKLQTQQEELKATNEELEQQTQILKASEEELRLKDEQQRAVNKQLEERTVELEKQKTEIEEKTVAIQIARDELKDKADELSRASAYKSEFLANMSHELRTPLNSLLILAKLFADNEEGHLSEDEVESAQIMLKSGQDLLTLINDILDLAKVEAGKMEFHFNDIKTYNFIENIQRDFTHVAEEKGIELKTEFANDVPEFIYTDDHRVGQIIRNLMSNAMKFTEQGEVKFSITRPSPDTDLSHSHLQHSEAIAFSVSDTGIGIPPEKQRLIFNSFQQADGTTSREYGGTGLGLSISTQLAEHMGGEIHLESQAGKGSKFILILPERSQSLEIGDDKTESPIKVKTPQLKTHQASVTTTPYNMVQKPKSIADDRESITKNDNCLLIVEDDLQFTKILIGLCRKKGFKCLHAADGETGIELAKQYRPEGILLDIGLPGMDGLSTLDKLKSDPSTQAIPVHIISASDEATRAIEKGAMGYLTKPINQDQLSTVINKIEQASEQDIRDLLIVEDDSSMLTAMTKLLKQRGVKITGVKTGKEALEKLNSQHFDCIILDLGLPDMTGQEVLNKYHEQTHPDHPSVIIHTGKSLSQTESESLNHYADSIIIKGGPASMERLIEETKVFLHRVASDLPQESELENQQQDTLQKTETMMTSSDNGYKVTIKAPISASPSLEETQESQPKAKETSSKSQPTPLPNNGDKKISKQELQIIASKKILLVDDDMRNTFALSRILKSKGLGVTMAADGKMALEALEKDPDTDIVLMDIMMPIMDGYEAITKIREQDRFSDLPIIALTAKVMKGDKDKCIEVGASDFLAKPIDIDILLEKLKQWLL